MSTKIKQLDFSGQKIYVGIDVHRKHFTVSIQGEELFYKTFNQPPKAEILTDYLKRHYPGASYLAAYEAGFSGFWLHEELEKQGVKCIVDVIPDHTAGGSGGNVLPSFQSITDRAIIQRANRGPSEK